MLLVTATHLAGQVVEDFNPGANGDVRAMAVQADGKILVGGSFYLLGGGGSGSTSRYNIGRLHPDGSLDSLFQAWETIWTDDVVTAIAIQPDQRIVVATSGAVQPGRRFIRRFMSNGDLDRSFAAAADESVHAVALQPDGRILLGGEFTTLTDAAGTVPRNGLARLHADGSIDRTFVPGSVGSVSALALQSDSRILVAGLSLMRLHATGARDTSFDPSSAPGGIVFALALQPAGRILIGGDLLPRGGGAGTLLHRNIARLNRDGSLDTSFTAGTDGPVKGLATLPNGTTIVGGQFAQVTDGAETVRRSHIAALRGNGAIDRRFEVSPDAGVEVVSPQPDGRILLGGRFGSLGSVVRHRIGRIDSSTFSKLVGTGSEGSIPGPGIDAAAEQGRSVAVSADGRTAIVGGPQDNFGHGAAWVWTRTERSPAPGAPPAYVWIQQGTKLIGTGATGSAVNQGTAVALSADGNTAIVGAPLDNVGLGAAWVWVRSQGVWTQQAKLVGAGATRGTGGYVRQGASVALSADGNTALIGGPDDSFGLGAIWVWTRSNGVWTPQGSKLAGSGAVAAFSRQGTSVAVSANGNTAVVGGPADNFWRGAAWVWTRAGTVWSQQGQKLVGRDVPGGADLVNTSQGTSVAVAADGTTVLVGGSSTSGYAGAAWVWTITSGVWSQQGPQLVSGPSSGPALAGNAVSLSADGHTALIGDPSDTSWTGAAWIWTRTGGVWTRRWPAFLGGGAAGYAQQGTSVGMSGDATAIMLGGPRDGSGIGAAWMTSLPAVASGAATSVTSTSAVLNATINPNGAYITPFFDYGVSAGYGASVWAAPIDSGVAPVSISAPISGLTCATSYRFRAGAAGQTTTYGVEMTFTTLACVPIVVTLPATNVTHAGATLSASVNPNGLSTTVLIDYGVTTGYGTTLSAGAGSGTIAATHAFDVVGLSCGTTYQYRARAQHAGGTSTGANATFTTGACAPVLTGITAGSGQLSVAFTPGASGGVPITGYEFSLDGGAWGTPAAQTAGSVIITGLVNGRSYTVRLRAITVQGTGLPSAAMSATPATTPDAPLILGITPGNTWLAIALAPGGDGGAALTAYEWWNDERGTWTRTALGSPLVVTGLTPGRLYRVQVRAVNVVGAGAAAPEVTATPARARDETADDFNPGADGPVLTMAVSQDKVLVGGAFAFLGGATGTTARRNVGRLARDGSLDRSFDPRDAVAADSPVTAIVVQPDARLLIATKGPRGDLRRHLGRLNPDGSLDARINPDGTLTLNFDSAANDAVYSLALHEDRIVVGGAFDTLGNERDQKVRPRIGRVDSGGSADAFNPGADGPVHVLVRQDDGRILVGGAFNMLGGVPRRNIGRLHADGTLDASFNPGADGVVNALALTPGGIVVGGNFTTLAGDTRHNVGRLLFTGEIDRGFVPPPRLGASVVDAILPLANGRILIGGASVASAPPGSTTPRHLARLHADGTLDENFEPDPNGRVTTLALHVDGILVGGEFTSIGGKPRNRIARLGLPSPSSPAPTVAPFTDDPIQRLVTPLRARHILELRERVDALRRRFNRVPAIWTDPDLRGVLVQAAHLAELRARLLEAYDAALGEGVHVARPVFADDPLLRGSSIRAQHVQQLRDAVGLLEVR